MGGTKNNDTAAGEHDRRVKNQGIEEGIETKVVDAGSKKAPAPGRILRGSGGLFAKGQDPLMDRRSRKDCSGMEFCWSGRISQAAT